MNIYGDAGAKAKAVNVQCYLTIMGKETQFIPLHPYEIVKSSSDGTVVKGDIVFFTPEAKSLRCQGRLQEIPSKDFTEEMLDFEVKDAEYYTVAQNANFEYYLEILSGSEV